MMRVWIVGAGAVGQVYGSALSRAGDEVGVMVRPARQAEASAGYALYRKKREATWTAERWIPKRVATSFDTMGQADEVWVCTPTSAVTDEFLSGLKRAAKGARIVSLQPGLETEKRFRSQFDASRYCFGAIGMVSYPAPLPRLEGRPRLEPGPPEPGIAFCFPGGATSRFCGSGASDIAERLNRGGCPAEEDPGAQAFLGFSSSMLQPIMVGLEGNGFRFRKFAKSPLLPLSVHAAREALCIAGRVLGRSAPWYRVLLRPLWVRAALRVVGTGWFLPFDAEDYFGFHFRKIGVQTRQLLPQYLERAKEYGLPAENLKGLGVQVFGAEVFRPEAFEPDDFESDDFESDNFDSDNFDSERDPSAPN